MLIQVKNLSKSFKIFKREAGLGGAFKSFLNRKYEIFHALEDINLNVDSGEIVGILGENGAGKTTLIKLLVGLIHPTSGHTVVDGYIPWERKHSFLREISVVMGQKNQLWWDIPASESFLLNKSLYGIPDKDYEDTLNELVDLLDVREKLNVQVRRLSLGERMKMEIIAALLHKPKIVLLDEPTIGLDVISQSKIREFVLHYNRVNKTTFLLTSHYMNDIQAMCKRVFVIHKGKSLYDGDFTTLVDKINPHRKLTFEFSSTPNPSFIENLRLKYDFTFSNGILTAELPVDQMNRLISQLFKDDTPTIFTVEELPVEDTMKSFFSNPEKFI
jgi:ABC-2 type transport system ATP-binding protein